MNFSGARATAISAGVLSIMLLGDALLYVVLPVNAAEFGITLAWVGVLLSANRFIRIFTYGLIARATDAVGLRTMTLITAIAGAGSTLMYGFIDGGPILLVARIIWGLSFAAASLTTLAYAVADRGRAG
ncbi:MAG: MFS transporter, partial [Alphaproteobacteria bacterium]|nr:MFS transporter [Alphaproteobacteria bacterium]